MQRKQTVQGRGYINFSYSTQLSMKFQMFLSIKISVKSAFFQAQISLECYFAAHKCRLIRTRGYVFFFMLNFAEHEIPNAHIYKNINRFSFLLAQISLQCYFPTHKC